MMSIWYGPAGSGKSLHAVGRTLRDVSRGLHVYTNLPINLDGVARYYDESDTPWRDLLHVHEGEEFKTVFRWGVKGESEARPCVLRWDECSNELDSYFKGQDLFELLTWIRLHRHYFWDVELMTQDHALVQARIRAQCHQMWEHTNATNLVIDGLGWNLSKVAKGWLICRRVDKATQKPLTRRFWSRVNMEWAACYKTDSENDCRNGEVKLRLGSLKTEVDDMTRGQKRIMAAGLVAGVAALCVGCVALLFALKARAVEHPVSQNVGATALAASAVAAEQQRDRTHGVAVAAGVDGRTWAMGADGRIVALPYRVKRGS